MPCFRSAPDPEAARRVTVSKGEATVGDVCVGGEAGDPNLITVVAEGLARLAKVAREEVGEDIYQRLGMEQGAG